MNLPKTIKCKNCGTLYIETRGRCPKCGTVYVAENDADKSLTKAMIIAAVAIGAVAFLSFIIPLILSLVSTLLPLLAAIIFLIIEAISEGFFSSDFFEQSIYALINLPFFF